MNEHLQVYSWHFCRGIAWLGAAVLIVLTFAGCGGSNSAGNGNACITCSPPTSSHYVFTANAAGSPSTVSAFTSDKTSGTLASISGSPFTAGSGARALAASTATKRLFVGNMFSGDISAFTVDSKNGKLSAVAGSPFSIEAGINSIAVDPAGKFLYAVSQSSANLWAFSIDSTGALVAVAGSPVTFTATPNAAAYSVIVDPTGKYVYVAGISGTPGTSSLYSFSIDSSTGALTPINFSLILYGFANQMAFDPSGKVLLVTGTGVFGTGGGVEVFTFNSTTGGLVLGLNSPNQVGTDPRGAAVDATGKYVYVPNTADATISAFVLDSTSGALTPVPGSPFPSGGNGSINGPLGITADTSGHFIFVSNASNDISVFSINTATGALTPIAGSPFPAGGNAPSAIVFWP